MIWLNATAFVGVSAGSLSFIVVTVIHAYDRELLPMHRRLPGENNDTAGIAGLVYHWMLDRIW